MWRRQLLNESLGPMDKTRPGSYSSSRYVARYCGDLMAIRWFICPVVIVDGQRRAKLYNFLEPGTDDGTGLSRYAWVGNTFNGNPGVGFDDVYLLKVTASDFTPIDADPEIIDIFDNQWVSQNNEVADMGSTPRNLGWNQGKMNQVKNRLDRNGVDTSAWTLDTPLAQMLDEAGAAFGVGYEPSKARVG
jgi:hypothetical protein